LTMLSLVQLWKGMKLSNSMFKLFQHVDSLQKLTATRLVLFDATFTAPWASGMNSRLLPCSRAGQLNCAVSITSSLLIANPSLMNLDVFCGMKIRISIGLK